MTPEIADLMIKGGAVVVLAWILWMMIDGKLVSRHAHQEIVDPLKDTITEQREELKELGESSRKAVVDMTETQRAALAEQNKTIEILQALLEQQQRSGSTSGRS
jgi:uncharacterized coiled-coil protein SlyX